MIRVSHVSLPAGLNALARRGPADELTVYVSDALPPDRQRAAVRIALRASRRAGWRALLPAPSVALLLASGMTWLRRAASALRAHSVAWGTASAVLAAASTAVYFAAAPHQHGSVGLALPPAPAVSRSPVAIPSQPGHTSPRPAVGEDVGGRAAGSAEAAGHRGRKADVRRQHQRRVDRRRPPRYQASRHPQCQAQHPRSAAATASRCSASGRACAWRFSTAPAVRHMPAAACWIRSQAATGTVGGQARRWACSSVPSSPCRQVRASAMRPRTTSGGSPGVLAICRSVGSSYSKWLCSADLALGSPPAKILRHEPGVQPRRFSTTPRVLGETRWPFSSFPSVLSVTPVASAKARRSRMRSSTRRATT